MKEIVKQVMRYHKDLGTIAHDRRPTMVVAAALIQLSSEVVIAKNAIVSELDAIGRALERISSRMP